MTVRELIEKLQTMNLDGIVKISGVAEGVGEDYGPTRMGDIELHLITEIVYHGVGGQKSVVVCDLNSV